MAVFIDNLILDHVPKWPIAVRRGAVLCDREHRFGIFV